MANAIGPKVTIGLPVFNGERHLRAAVESILGQTYCDLEVVISDNASTDATPEICEEYARSDPRVHFERLTTNVGARRNYHNVLARAGGEYFKWSGHDDVLAPAFLERCVERLDQDPGAVLCATDIEVVDDRGQRTGRELRPIIVPGSTPHVRLREFFANPNVHQTIFGVIRRSALEASALFGPWYGSDRALLMELALLGRFDRVDGALFIHREHNGRSSYAESKVAWFTPERGNRPVAGYWRHIGTAARAVVSVPMSPSERLLCVAEYGRRGRARLRAWVPVLWHEAATTVRSLGTGGRPR